MTTVYGDTRLRAGIAYRALSLVGREGVPVVPGVREPLAARDPIFRGGFEGQNARAEDVPEAALSPTSTPEWLFRTVAEHPGEVALCAVGR